MGCERNSLLSAWHEMSKRTRQTSAPLPTERYGETRSYFFVVAGAACFVVAVCSFIVGFLAGCLRDVAVPTGSLLWHPLVIVHLDRIHDSVS